MTEQKEKKKRSVSITALVVGLGLFLLATTPMVFLMFNNQAIVVNVKSADQEIKELNLQNEDLLRGRVAERDSVNSYKKNVDNQFKAKDSTITVLAKKLDKEQDEKKEMKKEIEKMKAILKQLKWSDLKPVDDKDKNN